MCRWGFCGGRALLKLRKVQILGFKSFCDRTEVQLSGEGIAAIVGPNGCGKSNISDAITWVLGEQSAKSLRGVKMEDVIFAGTRDRKPTGMAEVSLTLVDPEVYDGQLLQTDASGDDGPEIVIENEMPVDSGGDWDESALRQQSAAETEDAVLDAQPGTVLEGETEAAAAATGTGGQNVVLKIRRRKFGRSAVRAGEITVTRRLFRSGESEYLLNGKICRLRDIQDIFMGTGLSGENYAIIGQERIGQLLSSKPLDRRSIIEEAAGITRFKTKKRLAELRLEAAKQNLARVNDIFEEVTKQMVSLKRQASKAERYGALRDELRAKLRVVLASRMAQMDAEQASTAAEITSLAAKIDEQAASVESMDAEHSAGVERGYGLDAQVSEANARASQSAVELEGVAARATANTDRIAELTARLANADDEMAQTRAQLASLATEHAEQKQFLQSATAEASASRELADEKQKAGYAAVRAVALAEQETETTRRDSMRLLGEASQRRSEEAQAVEALAGLEREAERLAAESDVAKRELEALGQQRGQVSLTFETVTERLSRLETEISALRLELEAKRTEEAATKRRGDELRAEAANLSGRRSSLEALIREHSYSTDTVRNLFRANAAGGGAAAPAGTLADFLEVDGQYESVVDEFLRDELNYVVVNSWDAADEGMKLLKSEVDGRATFLVHPKGSGAGDTSVESSVVVREGVVPLRSAIRVLNGFGRSLEAILPKLREGFVTQDSETAKAMAREYPQAYFLSPTGETFHNVTVTGGRPSADGPLALKRELREVQEKLGAVEAALGQSEVQAEGLARQIAEISASLELKSTDRREAERETANSGAALRQMESETAKLERRLQEWALGVERNREARAVKEEAIARAREAAAVLEAKREEMEARMLLIQQQMDALRATREEMQAAAAEAAIGLAGLEERRRNASANFEQTERLLRGQEARMLQMEQQLAAAVAEKSRREEENVKFAGHHAELTATRTAAMAESAKLGEEALALRTAMTELDQKLRTLRHETEALREQRSLLIAKAAKLTSDIEHMESTCVNDLGVEAASLRADEGIERIDVAEVLAAEEDNARGLKQRLENMGPVNMMALEEYNETAGRHSFLEAQRTDLLDSIENTQQSIKEIDDVSHLKFDEAFKVINENFSVTFAKLFGGGQAFMRLTDTENQAESGIDIVASPPGKKLQNILLLSGGEKALTALSLLVGIFQFQPSPFCVLDEVDAPLDETNVGRFSKLISEMSKTTQFVVITHSKRTMQEADVIYGVTMQEPGVSKIVSVNLGKRESKSMVA